jgi:hypothetical protein
MRYYRKPDLKAPRFRPKRYTVITNEFIKRFKNKYPSYKHLSKGNIKMIIGKIHEIMWNATIDYRDGIDLPNNIGSIFIGSCQRPTKFNKDQNKSIEYDQDIRHRNFDTDEKIAKIFYSNYEKRYLFKNRDLWEFKGHRKFTRKVAIKFKDNWNRYIQVDKTRYISTIIKREKIKDMIAKSNIIPDDYNEFKLD